MEREYELMYIVRPDLDEEQVRATMDEVTSMVAGRGGEVVKSSLWGRRRLAYLVAGFHDGYYVVAETRLPGDQLGEIERQLRLSETVIRHMITIARPVRQEGERPARGRERWRDRERGRGRGRAAAASDGSELAEPSSAEPAPVSAEDGPATAAPAEEEAPTMVGPDQDGALAGPLAMEGPAAPAAEREETNVPEARPAGDDDELDDDEDEDLEDDDDDDDEDLEDDDEDEDD